MPSFREAGEEFLAQRRIAVAGVSRDPKQSANLIYRRLRDTGHEVFAVNPNAPEVEGDRCWPDIGSIPEPLDGVVIVTPPEAAEGIALQCVEAGVPRVWLHRAFGEGSMSEKAVAVCREHDIAVIPGGCPCMVGATSDPGHRCMCAVLKLTGKVPHHVADPHPRPRPLVTT